MQKLNDRNHKKQNISVLCWNIGNPSKIRAERQLAWLLSRPEDVFVLTETKRSDGCELIERFLQLHGFHCISSRPSDDYGVLIASRRALVSGDLSSKCSFLSSRVASAVLQLAGRSIEIAGLYVPSRDASPGKVERKRTFLKEWADVLRRDFPPTMRILCGDMNILEPNHIPRYPFFKTWEYAFYQDLVAAGFSDAFRHFTPVAREYSWVGRTGDGYRYDHFFVSRDLESQLVECRYIHEPRLVHLSDHSAILLSLN